MALSITVKKPSGARFEMTIPSLSETIAEFKARLAETSGIPADSQRLIFRGHILKDGQTFADVQAAHGLENGQSMHVVPAPRPQAAANASTAATAANNPASNPTPTSSNPGSAPPPTGGTGPAPPFGGGFGGFPNMMEMQQQLMRNPEQMQAMMNSPIMESIMNNPQVARSLMMANPQMRELIERNPEIAHVFNDPGTFRQMMQMARNPSLMNEMMRNTDRQMANIEMMPGGFDALRRMHENIQAPLMDAATGGGLMQGNDNNGGGNANTATDDNPFSSLFQQNTRSNAPMPNPWAANNDTTAADRNVTPPGNLNAAGLGTGTGTGTRSATGTATTNAGTEGANAFAQLFQGMGGPGTAQGMGNNGTTGPLPGMPNGMGVDQMMQMMEDPMMQQLMQSIFSDPQMFEAMLSRDPQLQARMQSNPELARMVQNPAMMRAMFNPEVIRSIRQLQTAMGNAMGAANPANPTTATTQGQTEGATPQQPSAQTGTPAAGTGTNATPPANPFMAMMNAMAGGQAATPAPQMSQEQLEEMYSSQLAQLREMGFLDTSMCLQALQQSQGNVSAAIENLLSRFGG